jgi:hypothetical protein
MDFKLVRIVNQANTLRSFGQHSRNSAIEVVRMHNPYLFLTTAFCNGLRRTRRTRHPSDTSFHPGKKVTGNPS